MYQIEILSSLVVTFTLLGTLFNLLLVAISRIQQRHEAALHQLHILTETSLQERERAYLSEELHEEFAPSFSYLKLNIHHLKYAVADNTTIQESSNHIDDMVKRARQLSFEILPPAFKHLGLVDTLEQMINQVRTHTPLDIQLEIAGNLPELKNHCALYSYRILQEIVQNTVKHAQANRLTIHLKIVANQLLMATTDDGVGFDYGQALKSTTSLGLKGIINRTQALDGVIKVLARKGEATRYMIALPL